MSEEQKLQETLEYLKTSLLVTPNDPYKRFQLGMTLRKLGNHADAVKAFKRAVDAKPDYAECWYNLGLALSEKEQLQDAFDAWTKATTSKPEHVDAQLQLGHVA